LVITDLTAGSSAVVTGLATDATPETINRFRSLGFVTGSALLVERCLPFGGPIVLRLGGASFAIEPAAAKLVKVGPKNAAGGNL